MVECPAPADHPVQCTVNVRVAVVFLGVVTLTKCEPVATPLPMTKLTVSDVGVVKAEVIVAVILVFAVVPWPLMLIGVPAVVKLVPVKVTVTVAPRPPNVGEMLVSVATGGLDIVKVCGPLVPPAGVTVTFLTPPLLSEAVGAITKLAVTCWASTN